MGINSALGSSALLPAGLGFRNVLINGEFRINQRAYASGGVIVAGDYCFDRWKSAEGLFTMSLTFTSAPQGQQVTISSGRTIKQIVERENITAGTFVLSWTGTATGRVYNTGATPPAYAASPIVVTLDGLANVEVEFTASGGTQTLWKPQLEQNRQPTPFEQRPIGVELELCQRYYWRYYGNAGGYSRFPSTGASFNGTSWQGVLNTPITMRAVPSLVESSGVGCTDNISFDSAAFTSVSVATGQSHINGVFIQCSGGSGINNGTGHILIGRGGGSSYIALGAEL